MWRSTADLISNIGCCVLIEKVTHDDVLENPNEDEKSGQNYERSRQELQP